MKRTKFISTLFLCLSLTFANSQTTPYGLGKAKAVVNHHSTKKQKAFAVSGTVQQTSSYCGGARPPQEMLDRLATPTPYPNKTFYIRKGKTNSMKAKVVKSFTTDSTGAFSLRLAPGTYSIIVEEQLKAINARDYVNKNQRVDEKCLQEWWIKPYYLLEVRNKNIEDLNFTFHHRCFITSDIPCINYTGPLPP